ncbi:MAG: hypothetical protein AB7S65_09680 [Sulfuricurvum sp.]
MKKYENFEDLQKLGIEKIHERTHISRDKVELILSKAYGDIGKVQFMGFISILEREYGIDLEEIRNEYLTFRQDYDVQNPPLESVLLRGNRDSKSKWIIGTAILAAVLIGSGYFLQHFASNEPVEDIIKLPSTVIAEPVTGTPDLNSTEMNASADSNETNQTVNPPKTQAGQGIEETIDTDKDLKIRPIYKVWVGMIDRSSGEKKQMVTTQPFSVDTSKQWLIVLGHGRVEIESSKGKKLLKEKDTVYFSYSTGELKQISKEEFLEFNGGQTW